MSILIGGAIAVVALVLTVALVSVMWRYAKECESEIKRLQELADYRLNLLTKLPSTEPIGEIVQVFDDLTAVSIPNMPSVGTKLYTEPFYREWVGLTDAEIAEEVGSPIDEVYLADFRKVEIRLKELNT